jgi:hypothetical protein
MPLSLSCSGCGARLRAPNSALGRTLRCPKCNGPVIVPSATGPAADFEFVPASGGRTYSDDEGNPFEDQDRAAEPETDEPAVRKKGRKTTAKKKPDGFNPFDEEGGGEEESAASPPAKRKYRKDGDYNPFGELGDTEVPDPVGEGFDFGIEAPPEAPAGEFDFGQHDPRDDRRR